LSQSHPPLPDELVEFTRGGKSLLVGTCSAKRVPDCVRAVGIRVWDSACQLTILIPARTGEVAIANLRENPRIAITISHIPTHRTVQLKGKVLEIREGGEVERAHATTYREEFSTDVGWAGQPTANTLRLGIWPCFAIDVDITVAFTQTPGPVAGQRLPVVGQP
jgi:hypothetical protein